MNSSLAHQVYGLCLSAGLSTRLRPLTDHFAKARLPIMGIPSLYAALDRLEQIGIKHVAVNRHYHAEQVADLVEKYPGHLNIKQSFEPTLLGTGGALWPLKDWMQDRHLLLLNPDVISSIDLRSMIETHLRTNSFVTVGVMNAPSKDQIPTVHCLAGTKRILSFGKNPPQSESKIESWYGLGVFLISPKIFSYLLHPHKFSSLTDSFTEALTAGEKLETFTYDGYFRDFGDSLYSYYMCHRELSENNCELFKKLGLDQISARLGEKFCVPAYHAKRSNQIDIDAASLFFGEINFSQSVKVERSLVYGPAHFKPNQHLITSICIDNFCIGYETPT